MGSGASSPEMLENPQVLEDPQMCFAVKYLGPPRGSLQTGAVGWVRNERVTFHNVGSLDGLVATQFMPFRRVISTTCQENVAKGEMGMVVAMEGANLLVEFQKSKKRFIIPDHVSYYAIVPGSFSVYRYTGPEKKGRVDTIRPGDLGFAKEGTDKLQIWGHQATWSASELEIQKVVPAHFAQCPSGHAYSPVKFENGWRCSSGPNCCLLQRGDAQAACRFRCSTCNLDLCNRCYEVGV